MIVIDGSQGEGGGQILRSSLALSLVTGQAFRIVKIRAGRRQPGLLRQHLTAVEAAREVGQASVEGVRLGSQELIFSPDRIRPGKYHFAIGTAGSSTLVLQTVLPALSIAASTSEIVLEGGTHNPNAPPFDFLARVFLPLLGRMGPKISAVLHKPGFYPAGGGKFTISVEPTNQLASFDLQERGEVRRMTARAVIANLPRRIGDRELQVVQKKLGWDKRSLIVEEVASSGPGNVLFLEIESEHVTEIFSGFGRRGLPAEKVAGEVVQKVVEYLAADVPVGPCLADQLLLPMALAGKGSFRTIAPTRHLMTNMAVIKHFLPVGIDVRQQSRNDWDVRIG